METAALKPVTIVVLNAGSSSLKATAWTLESATLSVSPLPSIWTAEANWGRTQGDATLRVGGARETSIPFESPSAIVDRVLTTLWDGDTAPLPDKSSVAAVAHRVVHGAGRFHSTTQIDDSVLEEIRKFADFAPEHNAMEAAIIERSRLTFGESIPQFAAFDTAFHGTLPPAAFTYPGQSEWLRRGIRRYGFHGLSHQYLSRRAAELVGRDVGSLRLLTFHLGNGCSICAVRNGQSVDTTMGFTPLDGLMMGTRSGSVDPGILIYLMRQDQVSAEGLNRLLNKESGLKGISGRSSDMRDILKLRAEGNQEASLAFDVFVHRATREAAALLPALGGLDAIVFAGGIGEHSPEVREQIGHRLEWIGVRIDAKKNTAAAADADISNLSGIAKVLVIKTEEDWVIASEVYRLL